MPDNKPVSRRSFLQSGSRLAAGALVAGVLPSCKASQPAPGTAAKVLGANERINLAVIGVHGRGKNHIDGFGALANVRIAALCDVDRNVLNERASHVEKTFGYRPATYQHQQKLLESRDIDAVTIATPNHWHALGTIWALQAGKHVYVEKPSCHNVQEGRRMVEAARRYGCMVSVGYHNRSIRGVRQAMAFLRGGGIGEVYMARGLCFKPRDPIGRVPDGLGTGKAYEYFVWSEPGVNYDRAYMDNVDYDAWLGPAPERPFNYNRFHYNWHWHWDYGNGEIGNQGPHQWDIARWGLGAEGHPLKICSSGGYYGEACAQETPNTQAAQVIYADGRMIEFEVRGLLTNAEDDVMIGNLFYGTKGWLRLDGDEWQSYFGRKNEEGPGSKTAGRDDFLDPAEASAIDGGHYANFIRALRTNDADSLTCPIEAGHMSSALPLLANISYRLDRRLTFDPARERFASDREADGMLTRDYRRPYVLPRTL
ncbi:MAG: Gfo/Idh/MocA family oxidoreductase [Candidatus Aminicenantes bacterium]|nr:Gfo/Idh/MocA family oxidoreductase [Candidatus Aminicenantes bacterium]